MRATSRIRKLCTPAYPARTGYVFKLEVYLEASSSTGPIVVSQRDKHPQDVSCRYRWMKSDFETRWRLLSQGNRFALAVRVSRFARDIKAVAVPPLRVDDIRAEFSF